jgi:curved DNA-binding protein CbpA
MIDGVNLDPYVVLGVARDATADQLKEAYRAKSRRYHPDHGGDDWAFKIVVRAYELLSDSPRHQPDLPKHPEMPEGRLRPGVYDKQVDAEKLVDVEIVWLRYEFFDLVEMQSTPLEDRHLSGSMIVSWPDKSLADQAGSIRQADRIVKALSDALGDIRRRTNPLSARWEVKGGRFEGWLGYAHGQAASDAFRQLHAALRRRGLGVRQWTRDVTVPRPEGA